MGSKFKIGSLVWAKMKGFMPWPGKVIEPKPEVKAPKDRRKHYFVFFFGSENFAWVLEETIFPYPENKQKFMLKSRVPKGFKEAIEAIEEALKTAPEDLKIAHEVVEVSSTTPKARSKKRLETKMDKSKDENLPSDISFNTSDNYSVELKRKSVKVYDKNRPKKNVLPVQKQVVKSEIQMEKLKVYANSQNQKDNLAKGNKTEQNVATGKIVEIGMKQIVGLKNKKKHAQTISEVDSNECNKPKAKVKSSEKKKEKTLGRPPKKRAGSPVSSSASAAKKGKVSKEVNHTDIVRLTKSHSPDTSLNQMDYRDYISSVTSPKSRRTSQQPKIRDPSFLPDYTFSTDIPSKDSVIATPLKIGFLGLGLMGSGMVLNLLRSGHEVTVWNRTPSKCKDFIKDGALKGNSPSDVVQQCDITFSSVSDPAALKDLVFGNCGVLQGIIEGKGYVDMSTIDVETAGDIHEAITARGGRFLEAPVIGSKGQASEGSLVILAAGDQTLYDDCYSCFAAMGKKTFYLGETGSAAKMTLVLNMLRGTVIAGLAESLALAEKVGLDTDEVMQILHMDPVACPMIKSMAYDMLQSNYSEPKCKLQILQKDLRLAVDMSDSVDQPLHVGSAVNELYKKAKAKGYGEHDVTAVYRAADL